MTSNAASPAQVSPTPSPAVGNGAFFQEIFSCLPPIADGAFRLLSAGNLETLHHLVHEGIRSSPAHPLFTQVRAYSSESQFRTDQALTAQIHQRSMGFALFDIPKDRWLAEIGDRQAPSTGWIESSKHLVGVVTPDGRVFSAAAARYAFPHGEREAPVASLRTVQLPHPSSAIAAEGPFESGRGGQSPESQGRSPSASTKANPSEGIATRQHEQQHSGTAIDAMIDGARTPSAGTATSTSSTLPTSARPADVSPFVGASWFAVRRTDVDARILKIREIHPRAWESWTSEEDQALTSSMEMSVSLQQLAHDLQRDPRAVYIHAQHCAPALVRSMGWVEPAPGDRAKARMPTPASSARADKASERMTTRSAPHREIPQATMRSAAIPPIASTQAQTDEQIAGEHRTLEEKSSGKVERFVPSSAVEQKPVTVDLPRLHRQERTTSTHLMQVAMTLQKAMEEAGYGPEDLASIAGILSSAHRGTWYR
jgi:hypothetical protein